MDIQGHPGLGPPICNLTLQFTSTTAQPARTRKKINPVCLSGAGLPSPQPKGRRVLMEVSLGRGLAPGQVPAAPGACSLRPILPGTPEAILASAGRQGQGWVPARESSGLHPGLRCGRSSSLPQAQCRLCRLQGHGGGGLETE